MRFAPVALFSFVMASLSTVASALCVDLPRAYPQAFEGEFAMVGTSGADCDSIFAARRYRAELSVTGIEQPTAVLSLRPRDAERGAYFANVTFVGAMGPDCQFVSSKRAFFEGLEHTMDLQAVASANLIWFSVQVHVRGPDVTCQAQGEFTGPAVRP